MTLLRPEIEHLDEPSYQLFVRARERERWSARELIGTGQTVLDDDGLERAWRLASTSYWAEQAGLVAAAELVVGTEDLAVRMSLATAVDDEARHSDAFLAYAVARGGELAEVYQDGSYLDELHATLSAADQAEKFLMHTMFEGLAADEFILLQRIFAGDPLAEIYRHVRADETRHVAIGLNYLRRSYASKDGRENWDAHGAEWERRGLAVINLPAACTGLAELTGQPAERIERWFMHRHRARLRGVGIRIPERR
ncbi:MAG TPA: hypothetical protein VFV67_10310 [Actinophytocola sp.]|uniref:hypothetical protein n=1 Tax=Actinophytocola sp. TaxID=1872138 RepID=UPI002DBFBB10|nr:hypothetical protein [Actinophytocola sp.]HEU5471035.1 hypothetical protein [Actinophytocola sp.]